VVALAFVGCATGQTGDPTEASDAGATIEGHVVSDVGGEVEYWVQFGLTKAYGSESVHETASVAQNTPTEVFPSFGGLARSTLYHYRLCAQDRSQRGGPGCGEDRTVKTQSFACGETVTSDVRFTGNLLCQDEVSDPGLVIGAPGIEVDMHGFSMFGGVFVGGGGRPAIDNSSGFDDVTIRDGRLGNFGDGIRLEDASRNRILHIDAFGPSDGVEIHGGSDNEIRHSTMTGRLNGLFAVDTTGLVVADSRANGSFGSGMVFNGLLRSRVVRNEAPNGGSACCTTSGIVLTASSDNVVEDNRVGGWNGGNIKLVSGANNKLLGNEVFDGFFPPGAPAADTFDSEGDGIFVGAFTANTIVRGNHAHDNDGDGIEVQGAGTRITDNTADGNGDFGIDAVAGVTDGGGNLASGNGNPLQCRNVFCG
jgi:parallel beta-helix repeat protein